jgi:hypothetical protein
MSNYENLPIYAKAMSFYRNFAKALKFCLSYTKVIKLFQGMPKL